MREVTISPVLNGWIVKVGCQTLVYDDKGDLLRDFVSFLADPAKTEKRILETAVNRQITMPGLGAAAVGVGQMNTTDEEPGANRGLGIGLAAQAFQTNPLPEPTARREWHGAGERPGA